MFNFNNIRSIAAVALASASLLISCVGLEEDGNDAVGYLDVPALEVDLAVDDLLLTKALDFEVLEPSVPDVHFVVKDKNGTVRYDGNGLWEEPLVLPVGTYSVEASYGSNVFGAPYFTGSAEGSIGHLGKVTPELTMKLSNSLVKVSVASSLEGHFTPGNEVSFNDRVHTAGYNAWTYVPAGQDISVTLAGTSSAGTPASFTHTLSNPSPKVAYDVVCGKSETNWPEIKWTSSLADGAFEEGLYFKPAEVTKMSAANIAKLRYHIKGGDYADWKEVDVTKLPDVGGYKYLGGLSNGTEYHLRASVGNIVTEGTFTPVSFKSCLEVSEVVAAHNNAEDSSVELSGTTMTVTGVNVKLPAIIATKAEVTASGSFNSSLNNATGSFSNVELSENPKSIPFTNAEGWPYLPQGDSYSATVTAVCSLNGNDYTASANSAVTVPEPEFTVTLSAYTSYDKYAATNGISKSIDGANECDPSTLYNAGAKWGISIDLMKNTNYSKTLVIDIDGNKDRTYTVKSYDYNELYENLTALSWSSHTLKVSMTFDNRTVSKTQTHHITGLPYRASPPVSVSTSSVYGWTNGEGNAQKWESGYLQLGVHGSKQVQTAYKDFYIPSTINVSLSSKIAAHNAPVNTTCSIIIGSSTVLSVSSGGSVIDYKTTEKEETVSTQMTTSDYRVTLKNSYSVTSSWGRIYYVNILYR